MLCVCAYVRVRERARESEIDFGINKQVESSLYINVAKNLL